MRALMKMDKVTGVEFVNIEKPSPKDDEVLFQVKSTAICGSDLSCWKWNKAGEKFNDKYEAQYPFVLGHECCGIVTEVGSKVKNVSVGDRIAIETHIYCGEIGRAHV